MGISGIAYGAYKVDVEKVLIAAIADILTGVSSTDIEIQSYYDSSTRRKLSLRMKESREVYLRVDESVD